MLFNIPASDNFVIVSLFFSVHILEATKRKRISACGLVKLLILFQEIMRKLFVGLKKLLHLCIKSKHMLFDFHSSKQTSKFLSQVFVFSMRVVYLYIFKTMGLRGWINLEFIKRLNKGRGFWRSNMHLYNFLTLHFDVSHFCNNLGRRL